MEFVLLSRPDIFSFPEDQDLLQSLNAAGLRNIFMGMENGVSATLKLLNKGGGISPGQIAHNIESLRESGTHLSIGFIMFHPWVTHAELRQNGEYLKRIKFNHVLSLYANRARIFRHCSFFPLVRQAGLLLPSSSWGEQRNRFVFPEVETIYQRIFAIANEFDRNYVVNIIENTRDFARLKS